jgi:hypothetical protein
MLAAHFRPIVECLALSRQEGCLKPWKLLVRPNQSLRCSEGMQLHEQLFRASQEEISSHEVDEAVADTTL